MEEEVREQLLVEEETQGAEAQESVGVTQSSTDGSLGKFKDAQTLYSAYNNLQAEFTRKCQRLSELEKANALNKEEPLNKEEISSKEEISNKDNALNQEQHLPVYSEDDWNKRVLEFLSKNEDAKPYAKEICETLMSDKEISSSKDALSLAWAKIIQKNYKKPSDILSDEFIDTYVINNDKVKQKVMQILAKDISQKRVPTTVGAHTGSHINLPRQIQPQTMAEAKELARKLME